MFLFGEIDEKGFEFAFIELELVFSHAGLDVKNRVLKCGDGLMDFRRGRRSVELRIIREKLTMDFMCLQDVRDGLYIHHEQNGSQDKTLGYPMRNII